MTIFFSLTDLGLSGSSSDLLQFWLTQMQAAFPGYNPSQANLEYVQAQIIAAMAADLAQQCSNGATELFRTFGTQLVGVPYQNGVSASAVITITASASPITIATTSLDLSLAVTSQINVIALAFGIAAGGITITDPTGLNTQTWVTSGANAGDTTIPVTADTPNFAYPAGSTIGGTQEYLLPVLSQFALDDLGFTNQAELTVDAGQSAQLTVTAVQSGLAFNGAGSGGLIQSIQQLDWISSITLTSAASGGQDPEDDAHYLDRLATALQLQAPRPITASDFGAMAANFFPYPGTDQQEVGRATAIDGYDPVSGTFNNERQVAVAITDENGFALNADTLYGYPSGSSSNVITTTPNPNSGWGVAGWLQSLREINFIVNVISPTYSPVYVTVTVAAAAGWDAITVASNVSSTLLSYLSPSSWSLATTSDAGWVNSTTIRQSTLSSKIQDTTSVGYIVDGSLFFGLNAGPSNTNDLTLPGPIALPISSIATLTINVV